MTLVRGKTEYHVECKTETSGIQLGKMALQMPGLVFLQNSASTSSSRPAEEEEEKLGEALQIKGLLGQNTEEMASILRALNGEFIEPQAGGDLLRDGAGVLPTGTA